VRAAALAASDVIDGDSVTAGTRHQVLEAGLAACPDIVERADRVRGLVTELVEYREQEAARLLSAAIELRQGAGRLEDASHLAADNLEAVIYASRFVASSASVVVHFSHETVAPLSDAFTDVWRVEGEREGTGSITPSLLE
jgi:hypothetical protein